MTTPIAAVDPRFSEPEKTSSERAYRLLREDIVSGGLAPGLKLKVEMLRNRYGLGAGPLREALSRLSSDRLVILEGQRGFEVAPMSIEDARDIGNVRRMLEAEALAISIENGDDEWEGDVVAAYHRLERVERRMEMGDRDFPEWEARNRQFHHALVKACGSVWLMRLRAQMFDQHERYRRLSRVTSVGLRDISAEHKALLTAAIDRDVAGARVLIAQHIQRTTDTVIAALTTGDLAGDRREPDQASIRRRGRRQSSGAEERPDTTP